MTTVTHLDDARDRAIAVLKELTGRDRPLEKTVLVDDVFGQLRVIVWPSRQTGDDVKALLSERLQSASGPFWSGDVWVAPGSSLADRALYDAAWKDSTPIAEALRVAERTRTKGFWFGHLLQPAWPLESRTGRSFPPIVSFFSFKGGVGRTTALAALAIQLARKGHRVAVLDLDFEAPGVGVLLGPPEPTSRARWGVVDYLLERPREKVDLRDYYHTVPLSSVVGIGAINVVPAGRVDLNYMQKLARLDLEPEQKKRPAILLDLLKRVRRELRSDYVLLDSRAGLSEIGGIALAGIAHLHVIVATGSEQTWDGLGIVLDRLGGSRVRDGEAQAECLIVQGMVPENRKLRDLSERRFAEASNDLFLQRYYAKDADDDEDRLWYVRDAGTGDAPDVPVPIPYREGLAAFSSIDEIADDLASSPEYGALTSRVLRRLRREEG